MKCKNEYCFNNEAHKKVREKVRGVFTAYGDNGCCILADDTVKECPVFRPPDRKWGAGADLPSLKEMLEDTEKLIVPELKDLLKEIINRLENNE